MLKYVEPTLNINKEWFNDRKEITIMVPAVEALTDRHIGLVYVINAGYKVKPNECFYALINHPKFGCSMMIVGDNYNSYGAVHILFKENKIIE